MSSPAIAPRAGGRVLAIDLARFLALIGMMAAHTWSRNEDGSDTFADDLTGGRAAALFAVIAGIGVVFVTRRALAQGRRGEAARQLLGRGAALLVIGLTLGFLGTHVYVIIVYYGALFWCLAPIIALRARWLALLATVLAVVGGPLNVAVRAGLAVTYEVGSPTWLNLADPLALVRAVLLTGIYPVITWLVYALVGVLLGRALVAGRNRDGDRRLGIGLLVGGAAAALLGWTVSILAFEVFGARAALLERYGADGGPIVDLLLDGPGQGAPEPVDPAFLWAATPHTGTLPDLLVTAGIACAVIGACLLLFAVIGSTGRAALLPFTATGAAPLTVYSVHVALTALVPAAALVLAGGAAPYSWTSGPAIWFANVVVAVVIGVLLAMLRTRGPLESLVRWAGGAAAGRLRDRRSVTDRTTEGS